MLINNPLLNESIYPEIYHRACNYLVAFGGHGPRRAEGRQMIADALKACRRIYGSERARRERGHMLFISGMFPEKECPNGL